jgi:hypothetical protein
MLIAPQIRLLLQNRWFHGDISTKEAENRLISKGPGAFLVRFSTSAPGTYTMSKVRTRCALCPLWLLHLPRWLYGCTLCGRGADENSFSHS